MEKAWAKLHGSYAAIAGGLPHFSASHLLGVPTCKLRHEDYQNMNNFWRILQKAERRGCKMFASSLAEGEEENEYEVITGVTHAIHSLHEFEHIGEKVRLFKMMNPWR